MPFRDKSHHRSTRTTASLPPYYGYRYSAEYHIVDTLPRLTQRSVKITDRREVEIIEREAATEAVPFFGLPPKPAERTKKWSSERVAEIEETYE